MMHCAKAPTLIIAHKVVEPEQIPSFEFCALHMEETENPNGLLKMGANPSSWQP